MERRAVERILAAAPVVCTAGARSERASTYDLSTDGCMLQAPAGFLAANDTVRITFAGPLAVEGRVIWAQHRNAGVQFAERLPRPAVDRIVAACSADSLPPEPASASDFVPLPALPGRGGAAASARTLTAAMVLHDTVCLLIVFACAWVLVAG